MYRKRLYGSRKYNSAAGVTARERKRMDAPAPGYPIDLPDLRRRVIIEDYDFAEPIRHEILLYKTNRIDCYRVVVDGQEISKRMGWARVLEKIRKALLRLSSQLD